LELPEYSEEDALADAELEPAQQLTEPQAEDEAFELDDLDLPEFGEEEALADGAEAPALEPEALVAESVEEPSLEEPAMVFDELELPEYSEEDALADAELEPVQELAEPQAEDETFELDDLDLPEFGEEEALADSELASEKLYQSPQVDDENIELDDFELPEFGEEEALAEMSESHGLASEEQLQQPAEEQEIDSLERPEFGEEQAIADVELESESVHQAPQVDDENIDLDDFDLPQFGEEEALAALNVSEAPVSEPPFEEPVGEQAIEFDALDLPEYGEEEALADLDSSAEDLSEQHDDFALEPVELPDLEEIPAESAARVDAQDMAHQQFDEKAFDELLAEDDQPHGGFSFDKPIDAVTSDSAGMDIDAMLEIGEDWNGFSLSPEQQATISDEIPDDEKDIWSVDNTLEQALDEDWEDQPDLDEFNPQEHTFRTIDELMAEVESEEQQEIDDELKLDVGLHDFPDVIGDIGDHTDVDANSEAAGKLDLAKIYIEMSDSQGAIKLLEEAIVDGSDEIRREAKSLIDAINNR
ncbi:FimV/HubP family polar landmark protein, partial [Vibrio sp. TRT 29B02]|uniref:FimV/HubP family polar landmark protein n=1 Tax=Vibrio sp. TRT 29B02 TaxID=3418508 RepID=UPI003CF9BA43